MDTIRHRSGRETEKDPLLHEEIIQSEDLKGKSDYNLKAAVQKTNPKYIYFWAFILLFLAFLTRFIFINFPHEVVFDEVHFGKFGAYYLRKSYYFDVHPPLGKMIFGAAEYLSGYDAHYLFDKIGDNYIEHGVPYSILRSVPAFFGTFLVPLIFLILLETGHNISSSVFGASMVLFDNALITQSRLILLDSFLIFFDFFTVYAWIKFYQQKNKPYSFLWWFWMSLTGISLALSTSVKMVGLFAVLLIGVSTIRDLWRIIDIKKGLTFIECCQHFFARALSLIALPFVVYLAFFAIHFAVVNRSGPGDGFMSPNFQATLEGNRFNKESFMVYYGANITLMHYDTNVFLHSHDHKYPLRYEDGRISSEGQQVTGYSHEDANNYWTLIPVDGIYHPLNSTDETLPRPVKHNDVVRLLHATTGNYLLTHDVASPLTPTHQEVTCVSDLDKDRYNETLWKIQILDPEEYENLTTIDTKFKLIHMETKVALHSHKGKYGDWGFEQQEINGNKNSKEKMNRWFIDSVYGAHNISVRSPKSGNRPGLFMKFIELQSLMLTHNSALTGSHPFQSSPFSWPFLIRGISFWVKDSEKRQIYLIGNPLVWWVGLFGVALHACLLVIDAIAQRRGFNEIDYKTRRRIEFIGGFFLLGWALHYLPFFIMGRSLFLHHYLPALIFSCLLAANMIDFMTRFESKFIRWLIISIFVSGFFMVYLYFSPFTYGFQMTAEDVVKRKWVETWDFSFLPKE